MTANEGMSLVERLMGGDNEPREERCKLVKLANAAPELMAAVLSAHSLMTDYWAELGGGANLDVSDLNTLLEAAIATAQGE